MSAVSLTGSLFLGSVIFVTVAAFVILVRFWSSFEGHRPAKVLARTGMLLLVNALVLATALTQVNAQFLFFADWTDLTAAVHSTPTSTLVKRGTAASKAAAQGVAGPAATAGKSLPPLPTGRMSASGVISYTVRGRLSGLVGKVIVQLPPGYTVANRAGVRYPVIEAFQGYPGGPESWIVGMRLGDAITHQVDAHRMGPTIVVSPQVEIPGGVDTECLNGTAGSPQLETWLAQDVPYWVAHTLRVRTNRASWTAIGLSAGGWCAAMVALLHPAQYAAAIVMGGYFRPEFGPYYRPYPSGSPLATRYDLVALSKKRPPPVAIWLETSHVDRVSYASTAAFLTAAKRPLAVDATVLQHAGHRISLWKGLLPGSLAWLGANVEGFKPLP